MDSAAVRWNRRVGRACRRLLSRRSSLGSRPSYGPSLLGLHYGLVVDDITGLEQLGLGDGPVFGRLEDPAMANRDTNGTRSAIGVVRRFFGATGVAEAGTGLAGDGKAAGIDDDHGAGIDAGAGCNGQGQEAILRMGVLRSAVSAMA